MKTKQKNAGKATRRRTVRCQYCGSVAELRPASEIYGDERRTDLLYVCSRYPDCNSYVAVKPGTTDPMGPLANGDLRHLRIRAHRTFDQIWQRQIMSRKSAYRWMADYFGIRIQDAHIGMFNEYRCQKLIEKSHEVLEQCSGSPHRGGM